jgi:hypothetical protein
MPKIEHIIKRDWINYSIEKLNSRFSTVIWKMISTRFNITGTPLKGHWWRLLTN